MSDEKPRSLKPFFELGQFQIDPKSVRRLSYRYCLQNEVVILGRIERDGADAITLGMLEPHNLAVRDQVQSILRRTVEPVQLNAFEVRRALDIGYGRIRGPIRQGFALELQSAEHFTFERDGAVADILDEILGRAVFLRASDVHIESYENDVDVRFRIDGLLHQISTPLALDNVVAAISRLKVMAGLDVTQRQRGQDGRLQAVYTETHGDTLADGTGGPTIRKGEARAIDFRLSLLPGPYGEDAVLRVLDSDAPMVGLDRLGLGSELERQFRRLIENPEGLVLVSGPTGSGKTTTLYAALNHINTPQNKIVTVEDPIEYYFPKINQKQVTEQMDFASFSRAFLRHNPDIILIGEIRDEETANTALRAAQTGHLVFSTLHTNDAVRCISRLATLGVDSGLVAGSLLGCLAQRLVRRLCPECRRETPVDAEQRQRLSIAVDDGPFFDSPGCQACAQSGCQGRTGIFELMVMNRELADLTSHGIAVHRLRATALGHGMVPMLDDALHKARQGQISLAEILRTVPHRVLDDGLSRRPRSAQEQD